jgi:DNA-binding GntR family transcriptional regulator
MPRIKNAEKSEKRFIDPTSLEQMAYEKIKVAILFKELWPGEKIRYTDWAKRLGISRTPVRDALKHLEYEGLIIRESERQWHVYTLGIEEVLEIFEAREAVDGRIAYLAAQNINDNQLIELKEIFDEANQNLIQNDYEAYHAVDEKFHQLMNRASRNEYLIQFQIHLMNRIGRLYPKGINIDGRLASSITENNRIAQALFERNPEKAEQMQKEHLRSYRDHFILVLKKLVIPLTGPAF